MTHVQEINIKKIRKVLTSRGRMVILQVTEVRCRQCHKMLGLVEGSRYVEIKCHKCGTLTEVLNI